jgi:hypothetical protein
LAGFFLAASAASSGVALRPKREFILSSKVSFGRVVGLVVVGAVVGFSVTTGAGFSTGIGAVGSGAIGGM